VSLLDRDAFPDPASLEKSRVRPFVIRMAKRQAVDAQGHPLFQPRQTAWLTVQWGEWLKSEAVVIGTGAFSSAPVKDATAHWVIPM
jgi:hypothetical protein